MRVISVYPEHSQFFLKGVGLLFQFLLFLFIPGVRKRTLQDPSVLIFPGDF